MARLVFGNYVLNNSRVWNPYGGSTTDAPVSRIEQADNSSPLGRGIPKGIGTTGSKGEIIIDPDQFGGVRLVNGKYFVTLVLGFMDTDLGGAATLLWLKANDEFIYRLASPKRSPSTPIRIYGGSQSAVDPAILDALGASEATYWPGLAYVVLEDFDITPYSDNGEIPTFTAAWSTDVTTASAARAESTNSFADLGDDGTWDNYTLGYDGTRGVVYTQSNGSTDYIHTIDLENNIEIYRAALTTTEQFSHIIALPGSPYVVCTSINAGNSNLFCARLIHSRTGSVIATLNSVPKGGGDWEMDAQTAVLVQSDIATKYIIFGYRWASTGINPNTTYVNDGCIMLADITTGTLEYIAHPETAPLRTTSVQTHLIAWAWRDNGDGSLTAWYAEDTDQTIWQVTVTATGATAPTAIYTNTTSTINGLTYDATDNTVVFSRDDGYVIKVNLSGTVQYSKDNSALTYLVLNRQDNGQSGNRIASYTRAGFAVAIRSNGDPYLVDLGDGSATLINTDDWYSMFYDQFRGYYGLPDFYTGTFGQGGAISRYASGDATPNTVDASDILTSLMTYQGDYASGDLTFTDFVGNECSGLDVSSDTTIDALKQDVCNTLGIRETHDAGKVKFAIPPRDGSYALDATLTDYHVTIDGVQQSITDEDAAFERVTLDYIDPGADYLRNTQEYVRPNGSYTVVNSNKRGNVQTNLVMSATQAAKAAQRITYESDLNRRAYTFEVMPAKINLEPSDIVSFTYGPANDYTVVGEIRASEIRRDFTQALELTEYLRGIETTFTGTSLVQVTPATVNASAELILLDTALLSLGDDLSGNALRSYVVFLGAGEDALSASSFYKSTDGFEYTQEGQVSGIAPVAGTVSAISRNYSNAKQTDYDGTLTVQIGSGDIDNLAIVTEAQKYQLVNYAAIGAEGRWVLIAYRTVSSSGQTATLGEIIWGLRGTEVYLSSLATGDRFINLEANELIKFSEATSLRTSSAYYKGGYAGWLITSFPTIKHTVDGEAEKPYAVENLAASVVAGGIQFSCDVRERLGIVPVLNGAQSAGYSEGGLSIEWDIYDNSSPQVKLRTLTSTAENVTYTNAQIETDFGTIPDTITVKVYQMSRLDFRGHEAVATLTITNPATFDTTAITFDSGVTTWDAAA